MEGKKEDLQQAVDEIETEGSMKLNTFRIEYGKYRIYLSSWGNIRHNYCQARKRHKKSHISG